MKVGMRLYEMHKKVSVPAPGFCAISGFRRVCVRESE